jgi:hypothetical protein
MFQEQRTLNVASFERQKLSAAFKKLKRMKKPCAVV